MVYHTADYQVLVRVKFPTSGLWFDSVQGVGRVRCEKRHEAAADKKLPGKREVLAADGPHERQHARLISISPHY